MEYRTNLLASSKQRYCALSNYCDHFRCMCRHVVRCIFRLRHSVSPPLAQPYFGRCSSCRRYWICHIIWGIVGSRVALASAGFCEAGTWLGYFFQATIPPSAHAPLKQNPEGTVSPHWTFQRHRQRAGYRGTYSSLLKTWGSPSLAKFPFCIIGSSFREWALLVFTTIVMLDFFFRWFCLSL
jgi:hypothetical protein